MVTPKRGMQLDRIVLLGRTLEEYRAYFLLDLERLRAKRVLDIAGGVSSFCAEANDAGVPVLSLDPIYARSEQEIAAQGWPDLDLVIASVRGLPTYRWRNYRDPEHVRALRTQALERFLADYRLHRGTRYIAGLLPKLPFPDHHFELVLVSYLLLVYQEQLDYEFHRAALLEIMRVTRGEARIYPTVTFEAEPSSHLDRWREDPALRHLRFALVPTEFEFLAGSNNFLRVTHAQTPPP